MLKFSRFLVGFVLLFALSLTMNGQEIPPRPDPPKLVNDLAGVLSADEVQNLENKLVQFNDSSSTQITVVIVKSLNGYDKNEFARLIGEQWGVGQKGKNNGAVVLVKPKYQQDKGEVCIQTGYGLEGAIPDALAKRIVENEMIPNFQQGNYYAGIDQATSTMISLAKGEYTADQYQKRKGKQSSPFALLIPLIILVVVFSLIKGAVPAEGLSEKTSPSGLHCSCWDPWAGDTAGHGMIFPGAVDSEAAVAAEAADLAASGEAALEAAAPVEAGKHFVLN